MAARSSIELHLQPSRPTPPQAVHARPASPAEKGQHDLDLPYISAEGETPQRTSTPLSESETAPDDAQELPPADRGRGAYMFLLCCFVMETLVWGEYLIPYHNN